MNRQRIRFLKRVVSVFTLAALLFTLAFGGYRTGDVEAAEGIEDDQNREWKMLSERREKEMNKKEEAVEASVESIRRYDYKGEVFFVISGTLYYQGVYKLYEVCPEKPMRGEKKYSNEEYIRLDPDNFIEAIKVKEKQMERMMRGSL